MAISFYNVFIFKPKEFILQMQNKFHKLWFILFGWIISAVHPISPDVSLYDGRSEASNDKCQLSYLEAKQDKKGVGLWMSVILASELNSQHPICEVWGSGVSQSPRTLIRLLIRGTVFSNEGGISAQLQSIIMWPHLLLNTFVG